MHFNFCCFVWLFFFYVRRHSRLNKINRKKENRVSGVLRTWLQSEFLQWEVNIEEAGRMDGNQLSSEQFENDAMAS